MSKKNVFVLSPIKYINLSYLAESRQRLRWVRHLLFQSPKFKNLTFHYIVFFQYFKLLQYKVTNYFGSYTVFFCNHKLYEHILLEIYDRNYIRRNLIYIFYWGSKPVNRHFMKNVHDAMKVFVITNPREDA